MDINTTIQNNIGLIKAQLKRFNMINDPEAESIGYEALYNAVLTYDDSKGYKFCTYATCCIYNALGNYTRSLNRKRQLDIISYNSIIYNENGIQHELIEFLPDSINIEDSIIKQELYHKLNEVYDIVYSKLTNDKHRAIIKTWHDAEYVISNKEIAQIVGVSQPYVNQVINTFKYSLKRKLEVYYCE